MSSTDKKELTITVTGKPNTGVTSSLLAIKELLASHGFEIEHDSLTNERIGENPDLDYNTVLDLLPKRVKIKLVEKPIIESVSIRSMK